ncbi:MAG: hypothetical protein ACP5RS_03305 [Thermoplasmata archaeon]
MDKNVFYHMDNNTKLNIKEVRTIVENNLKDLDIEGPARIASASFPQGYWTVIAVYSRDIELGDKKQKVSVMSGLFINDNTGKVEKFVENLA